MDYNFDEPGSKIMGRLEKHLRKKGLAPFSVRLTDADPYAILMGHTSIRLIKNPRKFKGSGIFVMCYRDGIDLARLEALGLEAQDNGSDPVRPHAVHVPDEMLDAVIEALLENPANRAW